MILLDWYVPEGKEETKVNAKDQIQSLKNISVKISFLITINHLINMWN